MLLHSFYAIAELLVEYVLEICSSLRMSLAVQGDPIKRDPQQYFIIVSITTENSDTNFL